MLAWLAGVSLLMMLLVIWSALYRKGLLSRREAATDTSASDESAPRLAAGK